MNFDDQAKTWDDDPVKVARALAVAEGIRSRVPLSARMTGLEYGCGTGVLSFALLPHLKYITLADSSTGMLEVLREKIVANGVTNMRPVKLDLVADPLPEERFGLVYTAMTFHHIDDTGKILRDLYALLDFPGYLCVADLDREEGSFHGPDFSGHKGFDREDLRRQAEQAGFRNVDFNTVFCITKSESPGQTDFPVFLMVAEKI